MMNACERETPTKLVFYIASLKHLGFRLWPGRVSNYSNLPAGTYQLDQGNDYTYVYTSSSGMGKNYSWYRFLTRTGELHGYGGCK
jgi:hypothetical protein